MANDEHSLRKHSPGFVIPAGTQVVLQVEKALNQGFRKPGSVGVVRECPARADGEYLVEFADGSAVTATFAELTLRRKEIDDDLSHCREDLRQFIIYKCRVGSKAYGLDSEASDDDIRGIYLPSARLNWSLYALPEQIENTDDGNDEVFWEIDKFVRLSLKANPNVLETMWTPMVLHANEIALELREIRAAFLSKHIYKTYSGYVLSQFRRMKNAVEKTGDYKKKHAMHLVRLLYSGINALTDHEILVDVREFRDELLNIRHGELSFEEVRQRALELDSNFQTAFEKTTLPERPDYAVIDDFLVRARRSTVEGPNRSNGGEW